MDIPLVLPPRHHLPWQRPQSRHNLSLKHHLKQPKGRHRQTACTTTLLRTHPPRILLRRHNQVLEPCRHLNPPPIVQRLPTGHHPVHLAFQQLYHNQTRLPFHNRLNPSHHTRCHHHPHSQHLKITHNSHRPNHKTASTHPPLHHHSTFTMPYHKHPPHHHHQEPTQHPTA